MIVINSDISLEILLYRVVAKQNAAKEVSNE